MAATLLDIKCRMLLPKEETEEGEEEDPRRELVEQLLQYKMYKYMAYELKDRQIGAQKALFKEPTIPKEISDYRPPIDYEQLVGDMTLSKLNGIFKDMMKRQIDKIDPIRSKFGKIEKDEVNIEEKSAYIEQFARDKQKFSFRSLLKDQAGKMEIVVSFLIVLEFMKMGKFVVVQETLFDDIMITYREAA